MHPTKQKRPEKLKKTKYSLHMVLRPASVRGVEVAKASAAAKARGWDIVYSVDYIDYSRL